MIFIEFTASFSLVLTIHIFPVSYTHLLFCRTEIQRSFLHGTDLAGGDQILAHRSEAVRVDPYEMILHGFSAVLTLSLIHISCFWGESYDSSEKRRFPSHQWTAAGELYPEGDSQRNAFLLSSGGTEGPGGLCPYPVSYTHLTVVEKDEMKSIVKKILNVK